MESVPDVMGSVCFFLMHPHLRVPLCGASPEMTLKA